jgi:hypothetical protein
LRKTIENIKNCCSILKPIFQGHGETHAKAKKKLQAIKKSLKLAEERLKKIRTKFPSLFYQWVLGFY